MRATAQLYCWTRAPALAAITWAAQVESCYRASNAFYADFCWSDDMSEANLLDAFARYKVKSSTRARSALTADRALVLSCFYNRFHRAEVGILRYEEDLATDTGSVATLLRTHLAEALKSELDVKVIIAMATERPSPKEADPKTSTRSPRMSFHARMDLIGRVTSFDGNLFTIEFRKASDAA